MSSSCLKIISCGKRDSFDNDEDHVQPNPQGKDKRRWSFRKRSAMHRVLNNTVTSETPSSGNKGTPVSSDIPEKVPAVVCTEEKTKVSTPVSFKLSDAIAANADEPNAEAKQDEPVAKLDELDAKQDEPVAKLHELDAKQDEPIAKLDELDTKQDEPDAVVNPGELNADSSLDESVVIVIQSAVRTLLAQKLLLESKNITKLQAAVRGHLERRHAVGTLRCFQAIIKMQTLVRARRARILEEESIAVEGHGNARNPTPMGNDNARKKPDVTYTSIEKLLSNKFARQLMDSTPRAKYINIKCDPLKSDSAWKWLERWMAVSPSDYQPPLGTVVHYEKNNEKTDTQESSAVFPDGAETDLDTQENQVGLHDKKDDEHIAIQEQTSVLHDEKEMENILSQEQMIVPSENKFNSALNLCSDVSESDSKLITHDPDLLETQSTVNTNLEQINSVSEETNELEFSGRGDLNINIISGESETRSEQSFESQVRSALETSETQGKKLVAGSRKATNPNFLAAQSKFKELNSVASLTKSMSSTSQTAEDESYLDAESSFTDQALRKDSSPVEDLISSSSNIQLGRSDTIFCDASNIQLEEVKVSSDGSDCGTELSITSTLDSPERSDVGLSRSELEGRVSEDTNGHSQSKDNSVEEDKVEASIINTGISDSDSIQPERYDSTLEESDNHVGSSVTVKKEPEADVSKLQIEIEAENLNTINKSSPEGSPRSHVTASEPQGTPSSEISVKPKRTKGEKSGSTHKLKSSSAGKSSPSNPNHGSGERSSAEQSRKDHKSVKRRNSFGSTKPDHVDQDPRDSSSSNPLPSYMQPTKSAKAKALLSSSPKSSPDVLDKDVSIKKRLSLQGGNGRQGSPQIQRTQSEVPQTVKGNESQPQQDKMWRR